MRDWLNSILGQDGGRIAQFVLALVAVLLLILLLAWVIRRLQPATALNAPQTSKGRKRLGVLEASDVDARRRLVLVRRDEVEHLIMIGGPNDLLIESRILRQGAGQSARPNPQQMPRPVTAPTGTPAASSETVSEPAAVSAIERATTATAGTIVPPAVVEPTTRPLPAVRRPSVEHEPAAPPATGQTQFGLAASSATPPPPPNAEMRRPSLGDLLTAAAAAKSADLNDVPQPIPAAPPPRSQRAPLPPVEDDDDREVPTQIVPHRPTPPSPTIFPVAPSPAAPTLRAPTLTPPAPAAPPVEAPAQDVSSQIERALSDINGPEIAPSPTEFVRAEVTRTETVHVEAIVPPPPRRPTAQPPTQQSAPARPAAEPTPAPMAFRPTPPTQPAPPREERRPSVEPTIEAPAVVEPAPRPSAPPISLAPRPAPAPVSAPTPFVAPAPVLAPAPAAVEPSQPTPRAKDDDLEEEMAKLLSELGGPGAR